MNNQSILIDQNLDKPKVLKETPKCSSCYKYLLNSKFFKMISRKRIILKEFVDDKLQPVILGAILINTLSMAIEHHEQVMIKLIIYKYKYSIFSLFKPELLTQIVEYMNIIFAFIFLIEMILKLIAYGTYGYIKDAYNVFDFIIVSTSIYEVIEKLQTINLINSSNSGGISVLRTFRLLRIIKFIRFLPTMRRQFFVLLNSFNNVASFMSLLSLFIFIFR